MATQTTNLSLIKPGITDKIRIAQINGNMDILDNVIGPVGNTSLQSQMTAAQSSISAVQDGLAIVSNNNAHPAIAQGQFVYVKNHGSLAEGLYVATTAIAANGTLSASNLTADSSGGLNTLSNTLSEQIAPFFGGNKQWITNAELNSYTTTGIYMISSGSTIGGESSGLSWFMLIVFAPRSDTLCQIISTSYKLMYREYRQPNGWNDFQQLVMKNEIPTDTSTTVVNYSSSSAVRYRKVNGTVILRGNYNASADGSIESWQTKTLCTLPNGYRPPMDMLVRLCTDRETGSKYGIGLIGTNGNVQICARNEKIDGSGTGVEMSFSVSYPAV